MNGNFFVEWVLRSPLHGILSKNMMLITVTGRKSGRQISTPTNYLRDENTLWVVSWRARQWWRNLRGGANIRVLLAGQWVEGRGQVIEEKQQVAQGLLAHYQKVPQYARYVQIGLDETGKPIPADCERAAAKMVLIKIELL